MKQSSSGKSMERKWVRRGCASSGLEWGMVLMLHFGDAFDEPDYRDVGFGVGRAG
jgi:hypothetical protein